jgi:hypothetical protein
MSRPFALLALGPALLSACANSTQMVATWKDPSAPPPAFRQTLAVFMTKEPGLRRMVEDKLAGGLPGGVPSYRVITDDELTSVDSLRPRLAALGFDAAVVMRLADVSTQTSVSGDADFYGYWRYWGYASVPVYTTETLYSVASTLYSIETGRMVWMGRSQTVSPKNANKLADYSVNFVIKNLRKHGILA